MMTRACRGLNPAAHDPMRWRARGRPLRGRPGSALSQRLSVSGTVRAVEPPVAPLNAIFTAIATGLRCFLRRAIASAVRRTVSFAEPALDSTALPAPTFVAFLPRRSRLAVFALTVAVAVNVPVWLAAVLKTSASALPSFGSLAAATLSETGCEVTPPPGRCPGRRRRRLQHRRRHRDRPCRDRPCPGPRCRPRRPRSRRAAPAPGRGSTASRRPPSSRPSSRR